MAELGPSPLAARERNLSIEQARAAIAERLRPIEGRETVPLSQAAGRVLAQDMVSPIDVPAHDNSAMDGFAFAGAALRADAPLALRTVGTVLAGQPSALAVRAGECVRIMTGAVMPPGLDTVVPLELCSADGEQVSIAPGVIRVGENRRRRGEDLAAGKAALRAGRMLRAADVGLAASVGITQLSVMRRLRVAVFSTGDEVVPPDQPLPPNCIYDSNRYSLMAAIARLGMEAIDLGTLRDDTVSLQRTLHDATARADAIVTSGGVSAGDADHMRNLMAELGTVGFWKVAMRPGRPFAFGALRGAGNRETWLFALPGNPVAALVTFYVLARDGLLALAGASPQALPLLQAHSAQAIRKRPGRTEFQRGIVSREPDGRWVVRSTGSQGAGVLRSMSEANGLIVLGHEQGSVAEGGLVDVWLFDGLT
jgi:molybdopterin molybdotransferase